MNSGQTARPSAIVLSPVLLFRLTVTMKVLYIDPVLYFYYVSGSAKRCVILGEFQDFFNVERNKILLCNFEQLSFLDPNVALFIESRNKFKDLSSIRVF
ncbi:hypothetical protein ALC57_14706 [Trachymyrmex cornetzi]|uniref:STAS domain-containing protein n=1 Tax=Trachymyrmex cornetzi TaxID=471704 RepID=A0A151IXW9_9HYME|nr:hypothetical protein ALC57_14706 [Trachymyrmex cornetzi]